MGNLTTLRDMGKNNLRKARYIDPSKELFSEPSSAQPAGILDIARISLAEDPETRIRAFAEARGISPERYSIRNGVITYRGDDGKMYREIPDVDFTDPMSILKNIATGIGEAVSEVPPMVTGIATAPMMMGGPLGVGASMAATGGASVLAQQGREALAEQFVGKQKGGERRALEKAAIHATTQGAGGLLSRTLGRAALRDVSRLPAVQAKIAALEDKAKRLGIPLTPAETSNLASLKVQQKMLINLPQTSDQMQGFYKKRAENISRKINRFFGKISKEESGEIAGRNIRGAAQEIISTKEGIRKKTTSPMYEKAFNQEPDVDLTNVIQYLDDQMSTAKGSLKSNLNKIRSWLHQEIEVVDDVGKKVLKTVPENRLRGGHMAKLEIDDMLQTGAGKTIGPTAERKIVEAQNLLLGDMDSASPLYKKARAEFSRMSAPIDKLKDGIVGIVANIKNQNVQDAVMKLFGPKAAGPRTIAEARSFFKAYAPKEWQAVKRQWLQAQWEAAGKEFASVETPIINQGSKFRALLLGDARKKRMMRAALDPEEFKTLSDFADVLDAAGRVKPIGSDTEWNKETLKLARSEATPRFAKFARALNFTDYGNMLENYFTERGLARNADKVAEIITSPGASKKIKELLKAKPGSPRFATMFAHIMSLGVRGKIPLIPGRRTEEIPHFVFTTRDKGRPNGLLSRQRRFPQKVKK